VVAEEGDVPGGDDPLHDLVDQGGLATALLAVEQEAAAVEEPEALEAAAGRPEEADVAQHA